MRWLRDSAAEIAELEEQRDLERIRDFETARYTRVGGKDKEISQYAARKKSADIASYAELYPGIDAGSAIILAREGFEPTSEAVRQIAASSQEYGLELNSFIRGTFSDADADEWGRNPVFDDNGTFVGDASFDEQRNNELLFEIETAVANGADRDEINSALESGRLFGSAILQSASDHWKPYNDLIEAAGEQVDDQLLADIYSLPRQLAEELAADDWELNANGEAVSPVQFHEGEYYVNGESDRRLPMSSIVGSALTGAYGESWRDFLFEGSDEAELAQNAINERVSAAAAFRGDGDPFAVEEEDSGGGGLSGLIGSVTRPLVAVAGFGGQYVTNRFRQNAARIAQGIGQGAYAGGAPAFGQQGIVPGAAPISGQVQGSLTAGAGVAGTFNDLLSTAAAVGPVGGGARSAALLAGEAPDLLSGDFARMRERFDATDLGVLSTNPELQGDGFLLSGDAVRLRQQREAALTGSNGQELITFGRAIAGGALGLNEDSDPYNFVSGLTDFAVAITGPGEAPIDGAIVGARGLRSLPGARNVPILGKFDPLTEAGGITSSWRNTVIRPTATDWVDSWRGRAVSSRLAEMDNVDDIMMAFKGRTAVADARTIAGLESADEVADFLRGAIGDGIRAVPSVGARRNRLRHIDTVGARVRDLDNPVSTYFRRVGQDVPATGQLNTFDLDETYRWAASHLANASVDRATARTILDDLASVPAAERGPWILRNVSGEINARTFQTLVSRQERRLLAGRNLSDEALEQIEEKAQSIADNLTRHFVDRTDGLTQHFIDETGRRGHNPFEVLPDGTVTSSPRPSLVVEQLTGKMPVPDIHDLRALRRINGPAYEMFSTARLGWLESAGNVGMMALEGLTSVWKPLVLLRPAYVMRVVGEEQVRIAAAGGDSIANNPLSWFVWAVTGNHTGRNLDITGRAIDARPKADEAQDLFTGAMVGQIREADGSKIRRNPLRPQTYRDAFERTQSRLRNEVYTLSAFGEPGFTRAWAGEISQLTSSPLARRVAAEGGATDDLVAAVIDDAALFDEIRRLAEGASDSAISARLLDPADDFEQFDAVREVLDMIDSRIKAKVGESSDLRNAIANDSLAGVRITSSTPSALDANPAFIEALDAYAVPREAGGHAPNIAKAVKTIDTSAGSKAQGAYRTFLDVMGGAIIEAPTSRLSRAPAFRQNYWSFVAEHGSELSPDAARRVLRNLPGEQPSRLDDIAQSLADIKAGDRGLEGVVDEIATRFEIETSVAREIASTTDTAKIEQILVDAWGVAPPIRFGTGLPAPLRARIRAKLEGAEGSMSVDGFDYAAKAHAMEKTNDLLFSMTTRKQWADSARVAAPFAEAWGEVITTWGKQLTTNPNIPRRAQQTLTVMGDEDFAESLEMIPGWETIDGAGLIYTDDYGSEMVIIPWANAAGDMFSFGRGAIESAVQLDASGVGENLRGLAQRPFGGESPSGLPRPQQAAPIEALSIAASIVPGIGPAVAVGLNKLMTDEQKAQEILGVEVRDVLFPFGEPTEAIFQPTEVLQEFLPSWVRHLSRALTGDDGFGDSQEAQSYNSRVIAAAKYLLANDRSGTYNVSSEGEPALDRVFDDARTLVDEYGASTFMTAIGGPTPGRQPWFINGEDGEPLINTTSANASTFFSIYSASAMVRELRADFVEGGMSFDDASDAAFMRLVAFTGTEGSIFTTLGASVSKIPGSPPLTTATANWLRDNPEARDEADLTWGFFTPQEQGELDTSLLGMLNEEGDDREFVSQSEFQDFAEGLMANRLMSDFTSSLDEIFGVNDYPEEVQSDVREYRRQLKERFPSWGNGNIIQRRGGTVQAINELRTITSEGGFFADHEIAEGVQTIIGFRDSLDAEVRAAGRGDPTDLSFASSRATEVDRQIYRQFLIDIGAQQPALAEVIDSVFLAEVRGGLEKDDEGEE